jgi:hypothetical protein
MLAEHEIYDLSDTVAPVSEKVDDYDWKNA